MHSTLKKITATVAATGALTVGAFGVAGSAFAADGTAGGRTGNGAAASQQGGHTGMRMQVMRQAFKTVLGELGVTKAEMKAALQGGQTISQYATSLGKDPQTIAAALTTQANGRIDQAVTDGTLTQERADRIKSKVGAKVDQFLNRTWGQQHA